MAVADMQKLLLVGNNNERKKLMKTLHKLGCVEVVTCEKTEQMEYFQDEHKADFYAHRLAEIGFLFATIKQNTTQATILAKKKLLDYKEIKHTTPFAPKPYITFDEFNSAHENDKEITEIINVLKQFTQEQVEIKTDNAKQNNLLAQIAPFLGLPKPIDEYKSTKYATVMVGSIANAKVSKLDELAQLGGEYEFYASSKGNQGALVVVALKENIQQIQEFLAKIEFSVCPFSNNILTNDLANQAKKKIQMNIVRSREIILQIAQYEKVIPKAQLLHDFYTLESRKLQCESITAMTNACYFMHAWLPSFASEKVNKTLENSDLTLSFLIREPIEGEAVPTLNINNGLVTPYEDITNMFSSPEYKEIDPNKFVAFFFFIFFGMMLSDAGYGLLLTIMTGIILLVNKPPKGQANLVKIMFMGGISTIAWGIVFGSYFGFDAKTLGVWYWFSPIENPMMMLILSLGMGIFQMCFGLAINMVALIKKKRPIEGIFGAFSWYFMILGLGLVFLSSKVGAWLKTAGWITFILGLLMLMMAGACGKKGMKKVSGAFSNVYGIINFFSDLMSYTRIFGLGLATAVIGMVFNQIGFVIKDLMPIQFIGWIAAGIIMIIGHVFNLGINALGAYVHNSRLQFVEFFGKFYTGGGALMRPLGSEMKYYLIKPEEVKE